MTTPGSTPRVARTATVLAACLAVVCGGLAGTAHAAGSNAVTGTSPAVINIDNSASGELTVMGTAASGVHKVGVALDDNDPNTPPLSTTVNLAGGASEQPWSAAFPMADVVTLADGRLTILTSFDGAGAPDAQVRMDLIEPDAPTALPDDALVYSTPQNVVISALDPADQGRTHYTVGRETAARPTASDPVVPGGLVVSRSQQVKAVSFDAAGNRGPTMVMNFVIDPTSVGGVPADQAGTPGRPGGQPGGAQSAGAAPAVTGALTRRTVRVGARVWLRGRVTPWAGVRVTLRRQVAGGRWADRASVVIPASASDGAYSFRVPTRKAGRTTWSVAATAPGGGNAAGAATTLRVRRGGGR